MTLNRRPLKSRSLGVFQKLAAWLATTSITPNQISLASILFALLGAACLLWLPGWPGLLLCALGIQLRLVCNLLDGMVAMEGGKKSAVGDLYNELPDRVSDSLLLLALGYATGLAWLGWAAALFAALTAYIRVLGGALGLPQDFRGPQSKSQRMAVMTAGCLLAVVTGVFGQASLVLQLTLLVLAVGSALTCVTRVLALARLLQQAKN